MKTKIFFSALALFVMSSSVIIAGTISGIVTDSNDGSPIPFANVLLEKDGIAISGSVTDFEGKFIFANIAANKYEISVTYVGYSAYRATEIVVLESSATVLEVKLNQSYEILSEVEIVEFRAPLIYKDQSCYSATIVNQII